MSSNDLAACSEAPPLRSHMPREIHDHYFKQAKRDGYRSRAAYKLIEIDERKSILSRGNRVLDAGSAPGSWLQVASQRVGKNGSVVGIDLKPIEPLSQCSNIVIHQGDFREIEARELLDDEPDARFDALLSDMAPGTTGDPRRDHFRSAQLCEVVLDRCNALLRQGGNFVMKTFEGERYPELLERMKTMFDNVRGFKPKASRNASVEMFLIGKGFRADAEIFDGDGEESPERSLPPKPKPSKKRGW